jgi:hypothetical protein
MLGLGKREPVRQLKKAGVILKTIQQRLQIHISAAKIRKEKLSVKREEPAISQCCSSGGIEVHRQRGNTAKSL